MVWPPSWTSVRYFSPGNFRLCSRWTAVPILIFLVIPAIAEDSTNGSGFTPANGVDAVQTTSHPISSTVLQSLKLLAKHSASVSPCLAGHVVKYPMSMTTLPSQSKLGGFPPSDLPSFFSIGRCSPTNAAPLFQSRYSRCPPPVSAPQSFILPPRRRDAERCETCPNH